MPVVILGGTAGAVLSFRVRPPAPRVAAASSVFDLVIPLSAVDVATGDAYDLTVDPPSAAFTTGAPPAAGDWRPAAWVPSPQPAGPGVYLPCGHGTGGASAAGAWWVWVTVQDNPSVPVLLAGTLTLV